MASRDRKTTGRASRGTRSAHTKDGEGSLQAERASRVNLDAARATQAALAEGRAALASSEEAAPHEIKPEPSSPIDVDTPSAEEQAQAHEAASKTETGNWYTKKKAKEQSERDAASILNICNTLATGLISPAAKMSEDRRLSIQEPLAREIERLSPKTKDLIQAYSDPLAIITGFGMWSYEISKILPPPDQGRGPKPPEAPRPGPGPSAEAVKGNGGSRTKEVEESVVPVTPLPQNLVDQINKL